jgi:hypothetical protein
MENKQPFYVGQRVVALATSYKQGDVQIIKGRIYTVFETFACTCGQIVVTLAELKVLNGINRMCCIDPYHGTHAGGGAQHFAPITTRAVEIDAFITEQAEELIRQRETILTPVKDKV